MTDILEGLEDFAVKKVVDAAIAPYVQNGEIPAKDVPLFEKVGIDIANAAIQMTADKLGVTAITAGAQVGASVTSLDDEPPT